MLLFLDEYGLLNSFTVIVKADYASDIVKFLGERYLFITNINWVYMFMDALSPDAANTVIGMSVYNSSFIMVTYAPASESPSNISSLKKYPVDKKNLEKLLEKLK